MSDTFFEKILIELKELNRKFYEVLLTSPVDSKPYPNEHSCRLESPDKFDRFVRQNNAGKHNGKPLDFIIGFLKGGGSKLQAIRYDKTKWQAGEARSHCQSKGGSFEAAKE